MLTSRQNAHTDFTNKGAPLTNDEIDQNWFDLYDLIESASDAIGSIHTQNTDTFLDQGGSNEVSAVDLAALVYEADNNPLHTQGTDQGLDTGGANAVTAAEIKAFLNGSTSGIQELDVSGSTDGSGTIIPHSNSNAITVTFRSVDIVDGKTYSVVDPDGNATTNNITIATEGTETVDGGNSITIAINNGYADLAVISGNLISTKKLLS